MIAIEGLGWSGGLAVAGVLMPSFAFDEDSASDPVYNPDDADFPIQQCQEVGGEMTGVIVWSREGFETGTFLVPEPADAPPESSSSPSSCHHALTLCSPGS